MINDESTVAKIYPNAEILSEISLCCEIEKNEIKEAPEDTGKKHALVISTVFRSRKQVTSSLSVYFLSNDKRVIFIEYLFKK